MDAKAKVSTLALVDLFKKKQIELLLSPMNIGTLGLSFKALVNGSPCFLKTHLNSTASKNNLVKEISLLKLLYGDEVKCEAIELINYEDGAQIWMLMNVLEPIRQDLLPDDILTLISDFDKLNSALSLAQVASMDNFDTLLQEGREALSLLIRENFLAGRCAVGASELLALVGVNKGSFAPSICHGDLGPQNIMANKQKKIAIDWEDAFYGVQGYDYLYWLTFFQNRQYYSRAVLEKSGLDFQMAKGIMTLIILIKSKLSLISGNMKSHSVSINDRLLEVINLNHNPSNNYI